MDEEKDLPSNDDSNDGLGGIDWMVLSACMTTRYVVCNGWCLMCTVVERYSGGKKQQKKKPSPWTTSSKLLGGKNGFDGIISAASKLTSTMPPHDDIMEREQTGSSG